MEQDNIEMNEKQSDKKDKKILLIVILLLVVVTAGAACWYLSTREDTSGKTITLVTTGSEKNVEISGLKLTSLSGTVVNGKGEKKDIKGQGIKLADVIGVTDYSEVTVTADDAYAARKGHPSRVVFGMLSASFLSTLAGMYLPGEHSLIHSVEIKLRKPVYIGDTLQICGTVSDKSDAVKIIQVKFVMTNQDGVKVAKGEMQIGVEV